jgi:hypothetical protein
MSRGARAGAFRRLPQPRPERVIGMSLRRRRVNEHADPQPHQVRRTTAVSTVSGSGARPPTHPGRPPPPRGGQVPGQRPPRGTPGDPYRGGDRVRPVAPGVMTKKRHSPEPCDRSTRHNPVVLPPAMVMLMEQTPASKPDCVPAAAPSRTRAPWKTASARSAAQAINK